MNNTCLFCLYFFSFMFLLLLIVRCDVTWCCYKKTGFLQTHNAMWKAQEFWPKTHAGFSSTSGTTASIAFIKNGRLFIGHVGDSKIVLGQCDEGDSWKSVELTQDHKPESTEEKQRILLAGGKVMSKAGVPRVVWHRPKTVCPQGRTLRSTKTEEIPFLAIARSLGDLWSFNSSSGQFVVSPDPDLMVYDIDQLKHKCLIFGTDGVWNVISPQTAVNIIHNAAMDGSNPSDSLVNEAIHRWNVNDKRADNVSVVTLMLGVDSEMTQNLPSTENIAFIEEEDEDIYDDDDEEEEDLYTTNYPEYQDISHMAVNSECDALKAHKRNPKNAIFPKCVMRQLNPNTFERYDYVTDSS